jgi:predicted nucleic acid-binding protein
MIYLDSNVFIIAALYTNTLAEKARELIREVEEGKVKTATSALTYDEVYWSVRKIKDKGAALKAGDALLTLSNLSIIGVDRTVLFKAHGLLEEYLLHPRDAIHVASALSRGIKTVISEDKDFDKVKSITRISLGDFRLSTIK